jgi:hypothetical protein
MAGEWIAVDCDLPDKAEIHELMEITSHSVEICCFRVYRLWAWFQKHSADGTAKATPARLASMICGDADFWRAVERVGWLSFDSTAGIVTLIGWEKRFSKAAKARILSAERVKKHRNGDVTHDRYKNVTRGEERRGEARPSTTTARVASPEEQEAHWHTLVAAWNASGLPAWRSPRPPRDAMARIAEDGWLEVATAAIAHLAAGRCKFFTDPVALDQFCGEGFADRVIGHKFDKPRKQPAQRFDPDKPVPKAWGGDDAARLEATRRKMVESLQHEGKK